MLLAVLILIIAAGILLFLLLLQRREIKSISSQLRDIQPKTTNQLIHTQGGNLACEELINEINTILTRAQSDRIEYQKKSHALEQMLTNISHDLRTPLTSAMGYMGIIHKSQLSKKELEREIEIIEKKLFRLEELINSFFEFSRILSSDTKPEMEDINLVAVLEEAIVHYYDDYSGQNRQIIFHHDDARLPSRSNHNMLLRIFDNLIGNGLKHGVGNVSVILTRSDVVQIQVENMIIDSEIDIERIFDEFYTTDISRTKGSTGLGLAIAKQFTQMLDGEISGKCDGKLFSVTITFPL